MEASARPVRVLVVEDDEDIAQALQRSLRLEGYDVKIAADGVPRSTSPTPSCPTSSSSTSGCRGSTGSTSPGACARTATTCRS